MKAWGEGAKIGAVYKISESDFERVGDCWMRGRLKDGDLAMCLEHSGDCFYYYILLKQISNGCEGILESRFGAYFLGKKIKVLPDKTFHLLAAGAFVKDLHLE